MPGTELLRRSLAICAIAIVLSCSSGDSDQQVDDTFRDKCETSCNDESASRGCSEVPDNCVANCTALTSKLETQCGECVARLDWLETHSDGTCSVDELDSVGIEDDCAQVCTPGSHQVQSSFRAECEVSCQVAARGVCDEVPANCVDNCVVWTSSLETQCGKCVARLDWLETHSDGTCSGDELYGLEVEEQCSQSCRPGTHQTQSSFRAECEVACEMSVEGRGCEVPADCVEDCVDRTDSLETQCGKCIARTTVRAKSNDDGSCSLSPFGTEACDEVCATN